MPRKRLWVIIYTILISKDNAAARRRLRRRITNTLRKPTTLPTKLAKESEMVSEADRVHFSCYICRLFYIFLQFPR